MIRGAAQEEGLVASITQFELPIIHRFLSGDDLTNVGNSVLCKGEVRVFACL